MKKLIALSFILLLFTACSVDDNSNYSFEVLPVESVTIPDAFTLGETYPITISYFRPSTCHSFRELYYTKDDNQRTVAPITIAIEDKNCQTLEDELTETTFNFVVTSKGSYIFKFWQGEDENGEDQYLTIEVPVTEN